MEFPFEEGYMVEDCTNGIGGADSDALVTTFRRGVVDLCAYVFYWRYVWGEEGCL